MSKEKKNQYQAQDKCANNEKSATDNQWDSTGSEKASDCKSDSEKN